MGKGNIFFCLIRFVSKNDFKNFKKILWYFKKKIFFKTTFKQKFRNIPDLCKVQLAKNGIYVAY